MNNQNINWQQFLTEYMLRAMSNYQIIQDYTEQEMVEYARGAWDAIQAAELPESEKSRQVPAPSFVLTAAPALIPSNSMELKELAKKAVEASDGIAKYIAIDKHGTIYAYKQKPIIKSDVSTCWDISDLRHACWLIGYNTPPVNFRNELYEISKILNNEQ